MERNSNGDFFKNINVAPDRIRIQVGGPDSLPPYMNEILPGCHYPRVCSLCANFLKPSTACCNTSLSASRGNTM
jgi:hypothetical protein